MSYFVLPLVDTVVRGSPARVPKYLPAMGLTSFVCALDDQAVVYCPDATPADENALGLNFDVIVIPPLDNPVAVNATKAALEALNIPAQWVAPGMSYRDVLRAVVGMAQLVQRTYGLGNRLTLAGNLDLTMSQIPAAKRSILQQASDEMGLDRSGITGATTVRAALRILGQQFVSGQVTIYLGVAL